MKCLLVDDEPGIREGLAMLLRRRGFEVHTADGCAAARALLADREFDVVVTDWRLPDGLASTFAASCPVPVIAVSGHPEEVTASGSIRSVLAKPITPARLVECMAGVASRHGGAHDRAGRDGAAADPEVVGMTRDVQVVVDDVLAQLPADAVTECHDDGTFVVLRSRLPQGAVAGVRPLGGDLRVVDGVDGRCLELRLCRRGQPDADIAVVHIDDDWPDQGPLALDCDGVQDSAAEFEIRLHRIRERMVAGDRLCLLNLPTALELVTTDWESTHDMPMRERIGPRLPAELAELWS